MGSACSAAVAVEWGGKKDPPDEVPYSECLAQVTLHIKFNIKKKGGVSPRNVSWSGCECTPGGTEYGGR